MTNRETEARIASKLQSFLGDNYEVRYDACESGLTYFYYHGELYKHVENGSLNGSLNVAEYAAPFELKFKYAYR